LECGVLFKDTRLQKTHASSDFIIQVPADSFQDLFISNLFRAFSLFQTLPSFGELSKKLFLSFFVTLL